MKAILPFFLIALLCLSGCRPKEVLSSREMRDLLYDLHRVDGMVDASNMDWGYDEVLARYYQHVLDKHGVTQAQFDSSLVWYTDNPALFDKIYPKVLARLDEDVAYWSNVQAAEQRRQALFKERWFGAMPYEWQVVMYYMQDTVPERLLPLNEPVPADWLLEMRPKMQKNAKIFVYMKKK